ncbi:MAG: zinc-finger domain-containing protein [Alphaproteobacteria bacterium]|jgi:uncharacterized Zn-finger protein|nr:zinc-finger domain-containing protein [Alphaproteobacteria bacterium]
MSAAENVEVEEAKVSCDGGPGALGHPRVYLTLNGGAVDCPYCGRHYVLKEGAKLAAH